MKNNFGQNLKVLRSKEGLDQSQLGAELKVSRNAIGLYEKGTTQPKIENLIHLAEIFGVTLDELILEPSELIIREPEIQYGNKVAILKKTIENLKDEISQLKDDKIALQAKLNEILELALDKKK